MENYDIAEIEAEHNICQALIYNKGLSDIVLIGITRYKIYFWALKGIYSIKDIFTSNREILNIETKFNCESMGKNLAGLIDWKTKLLYISGSVYLFDIIKQKRISILGIEKPSILSVFNYCKALIGTKLGYIYFIKYKNDDLKIIRGYKVCDTEIINISYDNGFYYEYDNYYFSPKFVVQCKGKIYGYYFTIFELEKEVSEEL